MRRSILFLAIIHFLSCSEENNLNDNNQNELISNDQELLIDISDDTNQSLTESNNLSFLALGDSYTIGESVSENQRWPNQMINIALNEDLLFEQPIIIAKTGWRTEQLIDTLNKINSDIQTLKIVLFIYAKLRNKNLFCSNIIVICKCFKKIN